LAFEAGFKPYHEAIARVDLGPRFPKRDFRNLERVKRIVDAMIAEKASGYLLKGQRGIPLPEASLWKVTNESSQDASGGWQKATS